MSINAKTKAGLINVLRVLRRIWADGPISRIELSRLSGLDKSTITKITAQLLDLGLISEEQQGSAGAKGGRRPIFLEFNAQFGRIAGIELQPDRTLLTLTDLKGKPLSQSSQTVDHGPLPERLLSIRELLHQESSVGNGDAPPILGLGIGVPGIVDGDRGEVLESNPLAIFETYPLAEELESIIGLPAACENDANCCAWGGLLSEPALKQANFAAILGEIREERLHTGFGFVLNGSVFRGSRYSAGEFRSIFALPGAPAQLAESSPGDAAITELSRNTALLVNMLNLDAIVVGGTLSESGTQFETSLAGEIMRNWNYPPAPRCPVYRLPAGEGAVAFGAAAMFILRLMRVPTLADTAPQTDGSLARSVFGLA